MYRKRDKFKFKLLETFFLCSMKGGFQDLLGLSLVLSHSTYLQMQGARRSSQEAELQNKIDARNTNFKISDHSTQSWVPFLDTRRYDGLYGAFEFLLFIKMRGGTL